MDKGDQKPIGFGGWAWRTFFVLLAGVLLYFADAKILDVEKLANVVTIVVPVVAIWTLFDQRLLEWFIRTVRAVLNRIRNVSRSEAGEGDETAPTMNFVAPTGPDADDRELEPSEVKVWPFIWAILTAGFAIWFLLYVGGRVLEIVDDWLTPSPPIIQEPPLAPPAPPPAPPQAPPATLRTFVVPRGSSCWDIARRFTCSGSRLTELGPPLNGLDVAGECFVREGRAVNIPEDWPDRCAR